MAQGGSYQNSEISIGPVVSGALTQAEYEALTYLEVSDTSAVPALGGSNASVTFEGLKRVVRGKGVFDPGEAALTWARSIGDPGQAAIKAAGETSQCYAIKVELSDAPAANQTNTVFYFQGTVGAVQLNGGGPNDVAQESTTVQLQDRPIEVPPAVIA